MKKTTLILLLLLAAAHVLPAAEKIENIENEIKIILKKVTPSLVKVVSENARKYVATGIALESELVITTSLITRHPFARIYVETEKGEPIAAKIAGQDGRSGLTLLRLRKKGLLPMELAKPGEVGDWVALIGLFYDRFPSIYQGIISSKSEAELILNAPVVPGSAGGAVVNKNGELLGIIRGSVGFSSSPDYTFKDHSAMIVVSGSKNESGSLCYAIPAEKVKRIAAELKTFGKISRGWLGVNFNGDSKQVQAVLKNSPAEKAGILTGDQIEEIAGKPITSFQDIASALQDKQAGDKVKIMVKRSGKAMHLNVELGERGDEAPDPLAFPDELIGEPEWPEPPFPSLPELNEFPELAGLERTLPKIKNYVIEVAGARQLGVDVMEMTAELSEKFSIKEGFGLLVSRIRESSAAKKAGLQAGDIIIRANGRECRTTSDLRNSLNALQDKEAVILELYRDGQLKKFTLVPDTNENLIWNMKKFSEKMQNLKNSISAEARAMSDAEIKHLLQAREKAAGALQKQKELTLRRLEEERKKLAAELQKLEAEKSKLRAEVEKKYTEQLKKIQQELKNMHEKIKKELEEKGAESGIDSSKNK